MLSNCRVCKVLLTVENSNLKTVEHRDYICNICSKLKRKKYYEDNRKKICKQTSAYKRERRIKEREKIPGKIILHHTKYKEIHGIDEVKEMTESEHRMLHFDLRKDGKCNISPEELKIISNRAIKRTSQQEEFRKKYSRLVKVKLFVETLAENIFLRTTIGHNGHTNNITVYSSFCGNHGIKLKRIREKYVGYKFLQ